MKHMETTRHTGNKEKGMQTQRYRKSSAYKRREQENTKGTENLHRKKKWPELQALPGGSGAGACPNTPQWQVRPSSGHTQESTKECENSGATNQCLSSQINKLNKILNGQNYTPINNYCIFVKYRFSDKFDCCRAIKMTVPYAKKITLNVNGLNARIRRKMNIC